LAGPHRDDLSLELKAHELRGTGSQGQCRSTALALRLAAIDSTASHSISPILLLDDVFAELDPNRRTALAEIVRGKQCQTFTATPHENDLPFQGEALVRVKGGEMS
jgi:DNA replication and repair protein RecF